jgi:hypothetical protein
MADEIADGVNDIISEHPADLEIPLMIDPMSGLLPVEGAQQDMRDISMRRRGVTVDAKTSVTLLDQRESGELNYIIIQATAVSGDLPDGGTPGNPEDFAVFLQLDGFAQGGLEAHYDTTASMSYQGIKLEDVSDLGMPEQYGNWFLKKDTAALKVAMFRGLRPYRHRIRLKVTNLNTTSKLHIKFLEVSRRRYTALDGGSNARALLGSHYGF